MAQLEAAIPRQGDHASSDPTDTMPATGTGAMKRIGTWLVYIVGALSIGYLALYGYAMFRRPDLTPGDPIQIFRKPDAPSYS
jgi:hypothetical protein